MMRAWWLLATVGCFSPSAPAGAPCNPTLDDCPSGQVCTMEAGGSFCRPPGTTTDDATVTDAPLVQIDARVDASGNADFDNDGVDDAIDNCPTLSNALQENEDNDPFGDACDPCPPFVDGSQPDDGDGDGVGDACDPLPAIPGHAIASFEGFTNGIPAGWTTTGSITPVAGGMLEFQPGNNSAILGSPEPVGIVHVWSDVEHLNYVGAGLAIIGVVARREPATDSAIACQLVGTSANLSEKLRLFNTTGGGAIMEVDHALDVNGRYVLKLRRDGVEYRCNADNPVAEVLGTAVFAPVNPEVGIRVRTAKVQSRWVMVLTGP